MAEAERLRAQLKESEQRIAALEVRAASAGGQQRLLLAGGALVIVGAVLALLLRWLWPKKRWGDL